jgi:hypothetical protein
MTYLDLADDGTHGFDVRAFGPTGIADPTPASRSFTLDTRPGGVVDASKKQRQKDGQIVVKVRVSAEEQLTAAAGGKAKIDKHKTSYTLAPRTESVGAGETEKLKLGLKRNRNEPRIAKALEQGKTAKAKLTVKLTDEAGNTAARQLSVKLKG